MPDHAHSHGSAHGHDHGHGHHHDHAHGPASGADHASRDRRLLVLLLFTLFVMAIEAGGGLWAGSLALVADAGHMATDAIALGLAWWAQRISRRAPDDAHSYGRHRYRILAAFVNGMALFALTVWLIAEAVGRLLHPAPVDAPFMLGVSVVGLVSNLLTLGLLHGHTHDMNVRAVLAHAIGDTLGSAGAIVAALLILWRNWLWADPALSVVAALLILGSAWRLTRDAARVLVEGTPPGFTHEGLASRLKTTVPGLLDAHHIHAWMLTPEQPLVTLHAVFAEAAAPDALPRLIAALKAEGFAHVTVQTEGHDLPCTDDPHSLVEGCLPTPEPAVHGHGHEHGQHIGHAHA